MYFYAYFILDVMKPLKKITTVETMRYHRFFRPPLRTEDISIFEYRLYLTSARLIRVKNQGWH
jgi:hypothetical protein